MKKFIYLIFAALTLASCVSIKTGDPYDGGLYRLLDGEHCIVDAFPCP